MLARSYSHVVSILAMLSLLLLPCAAASTTTTTQHTCTPLAFNLKRDTREVYPFQSPPSNVTGVHIIHYTDPSLPLLSQSFKLSIKEENERTLWLKFDREELLITLLQYVAGDPVPPDKVMKKFSMGPSQMGPWIITPHTDELAKLCWTSRT